MLLMKSDPFEVAISSTLRNYATELLNFERTIVKVAEYQQHEKTMQVCDDVAEFFPEMIATLREHVAHLDRILNRPQEFVDQLDGKPSCPPPFTATPKTLQREAPGVLCEYHAQLNLAAIGYTMLHARSIALHDAATAALALDHLRDLVRFIRAISEAAPKLVVQDLSRHFGGLVPGATESALRNTQEAWSESSLAAGVP